MGARLCLGTAPHAMALLSRDTHLFSLHGSSAAPFLLQDPTTFLTNEGKQQGGGLWCRTTRTCRPVMCQLCLLAEIPSLHEVDGINLIFSAYELMHANLEVPIKKICLQLPIQLQAFAHTIGIV